MTQTSETEVPNLEMVDSEDELTPVKQTLPEERVGRMSSAESNLEKPSWWEQERSFFENLQSEVGAWSYRNFGAQGAHRPAMGIVEEICELYEALEISDDVKAADAIGDAIIYMADYFHNRGWNLADVWLERIKDSEDTAATALKLIGRLNHSHLKSEQGIRGKAEVHAEKLHDTCKRILGLFDEIAVDSLEGDLVGIVHSTWSVVSKRDWTKNPVDAHLVAEGAARQVTVEGIDQNGFLQREVLSIVDNPAAAVAAREIYAENAGVKDKVQVNVSYEVGDDDDGAV
jgi:hypothetical protein